MRVGVLTSSRADFGIYLPLLRALKKDAFFTIDIIAFGTHLSPFHGYTLDEIEKQGFIVRYKIESMLVADSREAIATALSLTMMKFSSFWKEHGHEFDLVFCLGDRYEMFGAVMAAVPFHIRFAHLHGGEKTLGAIDNVFRHCISHASDVHFTSTENYRERITNMIDVPRHVYHVGALSLDSLLTLSLLSIPEFHARWQVDLSVPTILTTFHPETINAELNGHYAEELINLMLDLKDYQFLVTMPNSDTAGNSIRRIFEKRLAHEPKIFLIENLGTQSYFTAMKYCSFLIGNTSSGIIEAASFGKFVINLGKRQEGRDCGANVIQTAISQAEIKSAVRAVEKEREYTGENIYFRNGAADTIISILKTKIFNE